METKENIGTANIQCELNRLWGSHPDINKTKACLFNLIVYTQEPRRTAYFKEIIKMIMEQFPCRIIFIQGDPLTQDNHLNIHLSIEESQENSEIACEQIFIEADGQELAHVHFLILPLFIPDLPIYLFWGQDPMKENTILPYLKKFATRIIFDSETTEDLQSFSHNMLEQLQLSKTPIVDMNWARIGGWREVLAQIFDSPGRFEQLLTTYSIKIIYNNCLSHLFVHPETQAIYLQAWLASRLDWQFKEINRKDQTLILHYQNSHTQHEIHLMPSINENLPPEDILEIEFFGAENYMSHLLRKENNQIEVRACNQFQCELPFSLLIPTLRSGKSFMQEIFYQKVSAHYLPMLQLINLVKWSKS